MAPKTLQTTSDVMDALGGTAAVARLTDRSTHCASNWRRFKTFPANTFVTMRTALHERGLTAPDSLWGMTSRGKLPSRAA